MTAWLWLVLLAAVVAGVIAAGWAGRSRRIGTSRRRAEALADVARRIDAAVGSLEVPAGAAQLRPAAAPAPPAPTLEGGTGGRAALVDRAVEQVAVVRAEGARLAAALVRTAPGTTPTAVAGLVDVPVYVVGPDALAFLLPGLGRADALGVVARLEAHLAVSGRALELQPGESAAELVTRLLGSAPNGS